MLCTGNEPEHCCWLDGNVCVFLEEWTVPGRHWVCGLRRELGSWGAVHSDPRYQPVHDHWVTVGTADCGDFPAAGQFCGTCGRTG